MNSTLRLVTFPQKSPSKRSRTRPTNLVDFARKLEAASPDHAAVFARVFSLVLAKKSVWGTQDDSLGTIEERASEIEMLSLIQISNPEGARFIGQLLADVVTDRRIDW